MRGLHPYMEETLKRLEDEDGIFVDIYTDFADIEEMNQCAKEIASPIVLSDRLALLDMPTYVGDAALYRLTFGALFWLEDYADSFFKDDRPMQLLALGFAMAHGKHPEILKEACDSRRAYKLIRKWAWKSKIGLKQLETVIDEFVHSDEQKQGHIDYPCLFAALTEDRGENVDYWMWECSAETVVTLLDAANRRTQAAKSIKDKGPPNATEHRARVFHRFRKLVDAFKRKKLGISEQEGALKDG